MSVFTLKLIALLSMATDHTTWFLYMRGRIGYETYTLLRGFGRIAFPIFCFLLVNGFEHSRDRAAYLSRLTLFAALSQIPYGVLFNQANFTLTGAPTAFYPAMSSALPAIALLGVCAVWYFFVRRDLTALSALPALVLGMLRLQLDGVWLLTDRLNVFYTLAIGLAAMCLLSRLWERKARWYESLLCAVALALVIWLFGKYIDYGYGGIALLVCLFLARRSIAAQASVIFIWCCCIYYASPAFALWAAASLIPILLYKGALGPKMKWFFYIFYPAHLTVLAALTIIPQLI